MSEQEYTRERNTVERWKLPLSGDSRPFAELSEMVREAHLEVEGRMRASEYQAYADYAIEEIDHREHLVITLVYPADPED